MVADISNYAGREQAYVKHFFLESYLESLVFKTASKYDHVAYVDGFSGPWQSTGENFEDTSFGIALAALRKAKVAWKLQGRDVKMSAFLVEKSAKAYASLEAMKARFPDLEVHTYKGDFVSLAPTLRRDVPSGAFAFFLVDPQGWRIDIAKLVPLLSRPNSEVVFNFMFDFINRAASINDQAVIDGLTELIPRGSWRANMAALKTNDPKARMAVLAEAFRETLAAIGQYRFVAEVPVLRPMKDRILYWLFYGTRHAKGIEVFRACHVKTEREQSTVRTATRRAREEVATGQQGLFGADVALGPVAIDAFLDDERDAARALLLSSAPVAPATALYGEVWPFVLTKHVATKPELNLIANELRKRGLLVFPGWEARKRAPADSYRFSRLG